MLTRFAEGNWPSRNSATWRPAFSINWRLATPARSEVRRSRRRISSAVRIFIGFTPKAGPASEHRAAAHGQHLAGRVAGLLREEKLDGGGHILGGGRPADGKAGVADAVGLLPGQLLVVHVDRVDHVDGDAVARLLDGQRAAEGYHGGLGRHIGGNLGLAEGPFGAHRAQVHDPAPALPAHRPPPPAGYGKNGEE